MLAGLMHEYVHEIIISVVIAVGGSALMYPFKVIKKEFTNAKAALSAVHEELILQRSNCLTSLQASGDAQVKLLEKAVSVLEGIHTSQAEMSGFLKGSQK